jgi:hypothetical protein
MFTDIITFLVSKDLTILMLPEHVRSETIASLVHLSSTKAFDTLKSEVPGEKRLEFQKLSELHDLQKMEAFLKSTVPHFQEIVTAITREQLEEFAHALHREGGEGLST